MKPGTEVTRATLVALAVVSMASFAGAGPVRAQVQGRADAQVVPAPELAAIQATVDPLKSEVQALRVDVERLQAALASLRLTVQANHQQYASHQHAVPYFGLTSAKSICPDTPVLDSTLIAMTAPGVTKTTLSGPPE